MEVANSTVFSSCTRELAHRLVLLTCCTMSLSYFEKVLRSQLRKITCFNPTLSLSAAVGRPICRKRYGSLHWSRAAASVYDAPPCWRSKYLIFPAKTSIGSGGTF
jgi:hypothetical protein